MEHPAHDALQQYFDQELTGSAADVIRDHVARCDTCAQELDSLKRLQKIFSAVSEDVGEGLDADRIFAVVEHRIAEEGPDHAAVRVVTIPADRVSKPPRRAVVSAVGAFAIAAIGLLAVLGAYRKNSDVPAYDKPRDASAAKPIPGSGPKGSSLIEVDFGANQGQVFHVSGQAGSNVVVWIEEE